MERPRAEEWYDRFKAAGGHGRVDGEKIWISENEVQMSPEAVEIFKELRDPENPGLCDEVVRYVQNLTQVTAREWKKF